MNNLTDDPLRVKFAIYSIEDRLLRAQHDPRTLEQRLADREADREARRRRLGLPPRSELRPLTDAEHKAHCKRVAAEEVAFALQIKNQIEWLVAHPTPPNEAQLEWIEERAADGLIRDRQFGQLCAYARRTAPRQTKSPTEIARAAVARSW